MIGEPTWFDTEPPATAEELAELDRLRPRTRGDCINGIRPCPFVGCRYHTAMRVQARGIRCKDPLDMQTSTCALDLADKGANPLWVIADALGLGSREAARQAVERAIERAFRVGRRRGLIDLLDILPYGHDAAGRPHSRSMCVVCARPSALTISGVCPACRRRQEAVR